MTKKEKKSCRIRSLLCNNGYMENLEFDINGVLCDLQAKSVILESLPSNTVSKIFDNFKAGYPQKVGGITLYVEGPTKERASKALAHVVEKICDLVTYNDTKPTTFEEIQSLFNGISDETMNHIVDIMVKEKQIRKMKTNYFPMK